MSSEVAQSWHFVCIRRPGLLIKFLSQFFCKALNGWHLLSGEHKLWKEIMTYESSKQCFISIIIFVVLSLILRLVRNVFLKTFLIQQLWSIFIDCECVTSEVPVVLYWVITNQKSSWWLPLFHPANLPIRWHLMTTPLNSLQLPIYGTSGWSEEFWEYRILIWPGFMSFKSNHLLPIHAC